MKVFDEKLRLAEEASRLIELAGRNGDCTDSDEAVGDVLLPTHPSGTCRALLQISRARGRSCPVAQLGEPEIAQAVGHVESVLLCDGQARFELRAGAPKVTLVHREQPEIVERRACKPSHIAEPLSNRSALLEEVARFVEASLRRRDDSEEMKSLTRSR